MKRLLPAISVLFVYSTSIVASEIPIKSFEDYCNDKNLPPAQQHFVNTVMKELDVTDCAEPQKIVSETHTLELNNRKIVDITPISGFRDLHRVGLISNEIRDISPIAALKELRHLDIGRNAIEDIKPILELKSLESFSAPTNLITDINGIDTLSSLGALHLDGNYIKDLSAIANMPQLEGLSIGFFDNAKPSCTSPKIDTIGLLENIDKLQNLYTLRAMGINIESTEKIENISRLWTLNLSCNKIKKTDVLLKLKNLREVYLNGNSLTRLEIGKGHEKLTRLDLQNNDLSESTTIGLENLPNLATLNISDNNLSSVSFLNKLTKIETLIIENNLISDLKPVENLTNLDLLAAGNNLIEEVQFSRLAPYIRSIELENNFISSLEGLDSLTYLLSVNFSDNPLADISVLKNISSPDSLAVYLSNTGRSDFRELSNGDFMYLELDRNNITSIQHLPDLDNLRGISLKGNKIRHLSGLEEKYPGLYTLFVNGNPIQNLDGTHSMPLTEVGISNTRIKSLEELARFEYIFNIEAAGLGLKSLSSLKNEELQYLDLSNNEIESAAISPKFTKDIYKLNLSGNRLKDITPLKNILTIRQPMFLDLSDNPLGNEIKKTRENCPTDGSSAAIRLWCGSGANIAF